ncbi:MAG TPA: hypothetical protein VFV01_34560 [Spirillospora sp.]|nr:hypothetical protein [Spirillospora sp.]
MSDGEQAKPSFATYPIAGLPDLADDGAVIPQGTALAAEALGACRPPRPRGTAEPLPC